MMDVTPYPNFLPPPIDSGYAFSMPEMKQESQMVSGYTRMRQRFASPPPTYSFTFWFSSRQFSVFRYFWHEQLKSGSLVTSIPLLVPETTEITLREGRFSGNYQPRVPGSEFDSWLVECDFILNRDTILTEEEFLNRYFNGNLRLFNLNMREALREWPRLPGQVF